MPICFVCNLPILSHQVGLVWQGDNAWDKLVREQVEESTIQQRLGFYKDFYSQVSDFSANNLLYHENITNAQHNGSRRRSSLAQLTDIIREWRGGVSRAKSHEVHRRGTLVDIARTLPWKSNINITMDTCRDISRKSSKKHLKSIDSDTKHVDNHKSLARELKMKISKFWSKYGSENQKSLNYNTEHVTDIPLKVSNNKSISPKIIEAQHRPSTSSNVSDSASRLNIEKSGSVTSIISPTTINNKQKDSIIQVPNVCSNSPSFERQKIRLRRQNTVFDENLSSEDLTQVDDTGKNRKCSLSPDSAANYKYSGSIHLSPERKAIRQKFQRRNTTLRHQPIEYMNRHSNTRETSPSTLPQSGVPNSGGICVRRQSTTTEEILIATGFRRQSTTEEMIRCRNFRRQSSQSDDLFRYRKSRRDSSAQITDGTIQTMFVETTSTFYESGTQTEPSTYDNNHYHEECLKCNSCGANLTGTHQKRARRIRNQIYCDVHFADVSLMECSDFMQQLRSFKPQSLGSAVARRKSSTTLIFPLPPQACSDEFCEDYPHNLISTPGYWIECSRQKISGYDSTSLLDDNHTEDEYDNYKLNEDFNSDNKIHLIESFDKVGDINSKRKKHHISKIRDVREKIKTTNETDMKKKKTLIEEQWEEHGTFELTTVEQETYEKYFYGREHWNYFTNDEDLGPVILSIKQENLHSRDQFRLLIRAISYTAHGLIPASCVFADRYNRDEVVRSLGKEVNLNPDLVLGQLPDTSEELLKLDQVFIKSELKVGVIYIREGQYTEEEILDNNTESELFSEFLNLIGEKIQLKGFDKYKGGLDTVHDLTGLESVYTNWRNIEIMFHVSTMLPYEKHDLQKLQRKRHIGNDIVCIVFLEADNTPFSPTCIKSHFLHTFIVVRTSPTNRNKITIYEISVVTRDEVGAYKPYLYEQNIFEIGEMFREWILTKIVNGERASYSAPKFARMQERTRSQMLEDIVANLQNHVETGQIPQPYRRGSWRPIGHMRSSSPLLDSVRDLFEDSETLAKDFTKVFMNTEENLKINRKLFDVVFLVGQGKEKEAVFGVRAILGVRSRIFQEMLYGIQTGFGNSQVPVIEILSRPAPVLLSPKKIKNKSNFLQVPESDSARSKSIPNSPMVKRAFSRLGIISGWGKSVKKNSSQGQQLLTNEDRKKSNSSQESLSNLKDRKEKHNLLDVPKLSMCADIQKVDKAKIAQREFSIIEFDPDTFRILLNYLHTGSCSITCVTIPGLICAAEHYDLPDLLQACFHHAKQFLTINVVCIMLNLLESYYWRYTSASELVNMILAFVETRAYQIFQSDEFVTLNESMLQLIISRNLEVAEVVKFEAILKWAMNRVKSITSTKIDPKKEFQIIMERLSRDIKLHLISPHDLIKVVLPSKAIRNEQILETLMYQANSGMYRINESYFKEYTQRLQKQDSRLSDGALNANCSKS